jgi:hypothetical protein
MVRAELKKEEAGVTIQHRKQQDQPITANRTADTLVSWLSSKECHVTKDMEQRDTELLIALAGHVIKGLVPSTSGSHGSSPSHKAGERATASHKEIYEETNCT